MFGMVPFALLRVTNALVRVQIAALDLLGVSP